MTIRTYKTSLSALQLALARIDNFGVFLLKVSVSEFAAVKEHFKGIVKTMVHKYRPFGVKCIQMGKGGCWSSALYYFNVVVSSPI